MLGSATHGSEAHILHTGTYAAQRAEGRSRVRGETGNKDRGVRKGRARIPLHNKGSGQGAHPSAGAKRNNI